MGPNCQARWSLARLSPWVPDDVIHVFNHQSGFTECVPLRPPQPVTLGCFSNTVRADNDDNPYEKAELLATPSIIV